VADLSHPLLATLAAEPWYAGQIVHVETEESAPPRYRRPAEPLAAPLESYLEATGIRLFAHQADAVDRWRAGADLVVATRTASGKSLAFNLCVATSLLASPAATALYLYPTKALANDQLAALTDFDRAVGLGARPSTYDGDTPQSARARIRRESRIIVSNPYGLHEYLAQPQALGSFWAGLAVVVIDEAHRYRGVFGGHVAYVIRRLRRIAARFGAHPRFILASATVANPGEHAERLVGRPVEVVDDDGGAHGPRTVALWDSLADPGRSALSQAARLVASLVDAGQRTICFTGSRVGAELVAQWSSELAPDRRIAPYRAGLRPSERRQIEQELRSGALDAVVSTDALELGIDVGGLDAAVLVGYPGTVASTWQQIGRAGRARQPSLGILVAGDEALDQYLVRRPATLFGAPVERAVVALDNPEVLAGQVMCAAAELAVAESESALFGEGLQRVVAGLIGARLLAPARHGFMFAGTFRPASVVRIDGRSDESVEVRAGDELVEVLERWRALREAHPGAVLLHRGERYRVTGLDLVAGVAQVVPESSREHTRSTVARTFRLGEVSAKRAVGQWEMSLGDVQVTSHVVGYKVLRANQVISAHPLDLPPDDLDTRGLWLLPRETRGGVLPAGRDLLGALHAAEHALIHAMPLLAMCDRGDAGGVSTTAHPTAAGPLVLLYDGYPGGSGIVETAYEHFQELVALTLDMVSGCDCGEHGCPKCCWSKLCGSDNEPMDRCGAIELLRQLQLAANAPGSGEG
jgi:DEAD/DEAH box helicase domain-containing protein